MTSYNLLREYQNHIVPQSYNAGFVILSYIVSLVGAGSSLELMSRRTGFRGLFNHLLLVSSAVTMGGVAIWGMHFIGNRAVHLANGEPEMQVAYSKGFTALSFFIPILFLLSAFLAIGTNNAISWWRVIAGGILCGVSICGMHYLGNTSIKNYTCVYQPAYVVGSAIISVVASNIALFMLFVFRAMWTNSWRRRVISAAVLASAVSGMHWCATAGTRYRFRDAESEGDKPPEAATVVVAICLTFGACFIIIISTIIRIRNLRKSAFRAQKVTLGIAVFDKSGRILVDPDGLIPSTVITDSLLEKVDTYSDTSWMALSSLCQHTKDGFSIRHPIFQWMFLASRNWSIISSFVGGMRQHVLQLPHSSTHKDGRCGIQLVNEYGEMIECYDIIFRELFCLAAAELADRFHEDLTSVGVLWDEILLTGPVSQWPRPQSRMSSRLSLSWGMGNGHEDNQSGPDIEEGLNAQQQVIGRGLLMLLARRIELDQDAERFVSAGYRFVELHHVSNIIRSGMQIQSTDFETKLRSMSTYATKHNAAPPGVHIGFFAIRASVRSGFDILVQKDARNLLPSMALPLKTLENWHLQFLKRFENMSVFKILQSLDETSLYQSAQESEFAAQLSETIKALCEWIQEPLFKDATLTSTIACAPCLDNEEWGQSNMIVMRLMIPIHSVLSSPNCGFIPLSFFKMRQAPAQFQQEFIQGLHQGFQHIAKLADSVEISQGSGSGFSFRFWPFRRPNLSAVKIVNRNTMVRVNERRPLSPDSAKSSSTVNLNPSGHVNRIRPISLTEDPGIFQAHEDSRPARLPYRSATSFKEIMVNGEESKQKSEQCAGSKGPGELTITATNPKTPPAVDIELQAIGHCKTNAQAGPQISSKVGPRKRSVSNTSSFVDILFFETIENR
ncbi:Signaling protein YkoW [Fusarium oxysporum f. sp. rapae]|uniref:Signaling protein YkoW n=1 Tax=Fusarium oxysporum f. sp. rapae TaxID=485398 RepID=A0A8J5NM06_FUSOX|nr:Signaling protein YkoW [Fusarium oxysporum f. sp. rapae]